MAAPDMDVIKEIPGYKVILKAVLKSQIQQLVEQLASHTDEESVILTASVSDGTLSHLGSDSGKFFLQDHEDIKSQFLGFCLKRHHRKKQEKDREEELQRLQFSPRHMAAQPSRYPPARQGVHPVSLARASPGSHVRSPGARHEPYSVPRPRRSLNQNLSNQSPADSPKTMTLPTNNQVIKIEPQDEGSNQSAGDINNQRQSEKSSSPPSSPLHGQGSIVKTDNADESSTSATANEASELPFSETQPAEGLGLDSDLSNLISGEQSVKTPTTSSGQTSEIDPDVNVKLESISESDMELEITGVEPGPGSVSSQDTSWAQNTSMGYDSSGATGNQADLQGQEGFNSNDMSYYVEDFDQKSTEDAQHISLPMKGHWNSFYSPGAEYSKMFTADEMLAKKVLRGAPTGAQSYFTGLIRDAAESVGIWKDPPPALNCMTEKQKSRFFDLVLYSAPQLKSRSREVWARFRQALQNRRKYVLDKRLGKRTLKGSKTIDA